MLGIDDTSRGHEIESLEFGGVSNGRGNSESNGPEQRASGSSVIDMLVLSDSWVGIHIVIGIHQREHSVCSGDTCSSRLLDELSNLLVDGGVR